MPSVKKAHMAFGKENNDLWPQNFKGSSLLIFLLVISFIPVWELDSEVIPSLFSFTLKRKLIYIKS